MGRNRKFIRIRKNEEPMIKDDKAGDVLPVKPDEPDIKSLVKMFLDTWPMQIELIRIRSKLNWEFYSNLKSAGFSEEQALEIIKVKGA